MVVLHVLAPATVGGLERVVQSLAGGQRALGLDVHVAVVVGPGVDATLFGAPLRRSGVTLHEVRVPARGYLRERAALRAICRTLSPHIVHTHGYRPDVLDAPVARREGVATVTTAHGFTGGDRRNRVYEWMQRRAFAQSDAVVAVSQSLADRLQSTGVPPDRLHVIRNAWTRPAAPLARAGARRELRIADDTFRFGWVGRLTHEKGADLAVRAFTEIAGDLPVSLSILGDGPEAHRLRSAGRDAVGVDRITWHGVTPDAGRLFSAFDAFVLSSRTEGTPIVLFEAMEAKVPIVATAVGGVPEVLDDRHAWLVPPDDVGALSTALRAVFTDRPMATERANQAHERLHEAFAGPAWFDAYASVYEAAVRSRRQRGIRRMASRVGAGHRSPSRGAGQ